MRAVYREEKEAQEHEFLCSEAGFSDRSEGRSCSSELDMFRTEYQRDRDKIIHSKAFRRLSHKTQVFLAPVGDHFRTRLTHTLEVAQISRTIVRALGLNEDLAEAIALGHDLGHTPFGHAGEAALSKAIARYKGVPFDPENEREHFAHNQQSLRVVEVIENEGRGLNLTAEVRDGIRCHTGGVKAETFEGRVVALADRIAYVNHDLDDAILARIIREDQIPELAQRVLGTSHSLRIETMVTDMVQASVAQGDIVLSDAVYEAMMDLRAFLFREVYRTEVVDREIRKGRYLVGDLFDYFIEHPDAIAPEYRAINDGDTFQATIDYIASMTDRFAVHVFEELFVPQSFNH